MTLTIKLTVKLKFKNYSIDNAQFLMLENVFYIHTVKDSHVSLTF